MSDEPRKAGGGAVAGGGGKPKEAAESMQMFVQATSWGEALAPVKTGDTLQFSHGQRTARKSIPAVNGVVPGHWTAGD